MKNSHFINRDLIVVVLCCLISLYGHSIQAQDSNVIQNETNIPEYNALLLINQKDTAIFNLIRLDRRVICLLAENERIKGKIQAVFDSGIVVNSDTVFFNQMVAIARDPLSLKIYRWTYGVSGILLGALFTVPGIWLSYHLIKDYLPDRYFDNIGALYALLIAPQLLVYGVPVLTSGFTIIATPHFFFNINAPWKVIPIYKAIPEIKKVK